MPIDGEEGEDRRFDGKFFRLFYIFVSIHIMPLKLLFFPGLATKPPKVIRNTKAVQTQQEMF